MTLKMLRARKRYLLKSLKITQDMIAKVNMDIAIEVEKLEIENGITIREKGKVA